MSPDAHKATAIIAFAEEICPGEAFSYLFGLAVAGMQHHGMSVAEIQGLAPRGSG